MIHKRKFRVVFLVVVAVAVFEAVQASRGGLRAQLPPSNPLVAPLPAPSAPAQLSAPVQALSVPSLVAVPSPPPASPTPSARLFNCSCYGPATGTHWMGQVSSSGYFAARQTATGACLSSNALRRPAPPNLDLPEGNQNPSQTSGAAPMPPGFNSVNQATSASNQLPGSLAVQNAAAATGCSTCVCD